jgi:hypothetical protein
MTNIAPKSIGARIKYQLGYFSTLKSSILLKDAPKCILYAYNIGMEEKLTKVFQDLKYAPSTDLAENVWRTIAVRETRITRMKLWLFSFFGFVSLAGLLPVLKTLSNNFAQSGFYDYVSLLFSDGRSVLTYWKEFAFSLAESLPTLTILLSLTLTFVFFLSVRYAMKQISKNQLSFSLKA